MSADVHTVPFIRSVNISPAIPMMAPTSSPSTPPSTGLIGAGVMSCEPTSCRS